MSRNDHKVHCKYIETKFRSASQLSRLKLLGKSNEDFGNGRTGKKHHLYNLEVFSWGDICAMKVSQRITKQVYRADACHCIVVQIKIKFETSSKQSFSFHCGLRL